MTGTPPAMATANLRQPLSASATITDNHSSDEKKSPPTVTRDHAHRTDDSSDSSSCRHDGAAGFPDLEKGLTTESRRMRASPAPDPDQGHGLDDAPDEKAPDEPDDPFSVAWQGPSDTEDPLNWSFLKKFLFTTAGCASVFMVSFSSSALGPAEETMAQHFGVGREVLTLSVSLFIAGYAVGPLLWAPLSALVGTLPVLAISVLGTLVFQIPVAVATNVQTVIICRFLIGVIGSGVLAVGSGMFAEVWDEGTRGVAVALGVTGMNMASTIGPLAGVYILERWGWRAISWVTLVMTGGVGISCILWLREPQRAVILRRRAQRIQRETGNSRYHAAGQKGNITFADLIHKYGVMPVQMIIQEPILIVITLYLILVYGTLYLSYQLFPYAFVHNHGWGTTTSYLPFISTFLGVFFAWVFASYYTLTTYRAKLERRETTPEDRLVPMMFGAVILPPALIWFGWAARTHWIAQVLAIFFIGLALQSIFLCGIVYIVDVYVPNANSAISIHVVCRSIVSASFPLWCTFMYDRLGVEWSGTLLAGLALLCAPSPFLFYYYGYRIRSWSRFCET